MVIIDDIVREMREGVVANGLYEQTLREFADRIEAACRARTVYRVQCKPTPIERWQTIGAPCNSLEEAEIQMEARNLFHSTDYATRIERHEETEWETVKEVCRD